MEDVKQWYLSKTVWGALLALSASVLYACRDAGVPVVATIHN